VNPGSTRARRYAHRVTISAAFHMGATEVTLGQYRQFQPKHH
jgi:formylglycine-generating enzyme required for sulfatase activity